MQDSFFLRYQKLIKDVVIPYQWAVLNDNAPGAEPSHAIENFRIAAGQAKGEFYGMVFQDSDVAKWLEAVAYSLSAQPDTKLERIADEVIALVGSAQQQDGYLNTYFTVKEPDKKWTDLAECHELYCAGHFIEAGVAYFLATGKRNLLDIVCRLADHIDSIFGREKGKIAGYPGHPEIELALMRLYEVTGTERYKNLCLFFVDERGKQPYFYDLEYEKRGKTFMFNSNGPAWMIKEKEYSQAHKPITQQDAATGHAVRFAYLLTGVAHLARHTNDAEKIEACKRLWDSVVEKQLYVTGAIGSQSRGEAFTCDYDLPPDTAYAETCASIGLMMFANRMLHLDADSRYADVMERALYNTVLGGMALDGKHFFYTNPLEADPALLGRNHGYHHVRLPRPQWFGCACCPPNIARLIGSLGSYIYTVKNNVVYHNLYIANTATIALGTPGDIELSMTGSFPWDGEVSVAVSCKKPVECTLAFRLPDWCDNPQLFVDEKPIAGSAHIHKGYAHVARQWKGGERIRLVFPMKALAVRGHSALRHAAGKLALQRGPFVYCLEEADNGKGLHNLFIKPEQGFSYEQKKEALLNAVVITARGEKNVETADAALYKYDAALRREPCDLFFIPYFLWANRGAGEMRVWVAETR